LQVQDAEPQSGRGSEGASPERNRQSPSAVTVSQASGPGTILTAAKDLEAVAVGSLELFVCLALFLVLLLFEFAEPPRLFRKKATTRASNITITTISIDSPFNVRFVGR